jgi:hypothetical protein
MAVEKAGGKRDGGREGRWEKVWVGIGNLSGKTMNITNWHSLTFHL